MGLLPSLILTITHKCNLRCRFCPVIKDNASMHKDVALKAASLFFKKNKNKNLFIKFFGGEPLLNFALVKKVIGSIDRKYPGRNIQFNLTTNGLLVNNSIICFLKKFPNIGLLLSLDGDRSVRAIGRSLGRLLELPDIGVNLTLTPNNVERFSYNFLHLVKLGFKKFNFLPAYFIQWEKFKIDVLEFEFKIVGNLIRSLAKSGHRLEIKNIKTYSPTPLFNNGMVVECNGDIFRNNLILSKHFSYLRPQLKIGNVNDSKRINWLRKTDFNKVIRDNLDNETYNSTLKVDSILTNFVLTLGKKWKE